MAGGVHSVAITGASGSLGTALVRRLVSDPAIRRIVAIDRVPPSVRQERVKFCQADVRDPEIAELVAGCDSLVHLAFIVERGSRDPLLVESVNVGGTINTMTAAAAAGVNHVVYASSIAAYGMHPENVGVVLSETAPVRGNADFYYSRTKADVEHWLDGFEARQPAVAVARLRPSAFMSGGKGVRNTLFRSRLFPYVAGRSTPAHVTHEADVADAFVLAIRLRARGAYNIATDEPLPMGHWPRHLASLGLPVPFGALAIADVAYRARLVDIDPRWVRIGARYPILVTSERARRELGWKPRLETTAEVLRQLSGRPTARASIGTRVFLGSLSTWTAMRGSLPIAPESRRELAGNNGSVNVILGGERPSLWHLWSWEGTGGIGRGADPRASGGVRMHETVFRSLVTGGADFGDSLAAGDIECRGGPGVDHLARAAIASLARPIGQSGRRSVGQRVVARLIGR